MPCI
jgi:hypothetical protein